MIRLCAQSILGGLLIVAGFSVLGALALAGGA
jgi:hypothetical protein